MVISCYVVEVSDKSKKLDIITFLLNLEVRLLGGWLDACEL